MRLLRIHPLLRQRDIRKILCGNDPRHDINAFFRGQLAEGAGRKDMREIFHSGFFHQGEPGIAYPVRRFRPVAQHVGIIIDHPVAMVMH